MTETMWRKGLRAVFVERRLPYRLSLVLSKRWYLQGLTRQLFKLIRLTAPVRAAQASAVETMTLLDTANVDAYLIAIKSFLHYSGIRPRITVISDGSLLPRHEDLLRKHVAGIRIVPWDRFDRTLFEHPERVEAICRRFPLCKKIFPVPLRDAADTLIVLDSDVIFRAPVGPELLDLSGADLKYNRDHDHALHDRLFYLAARHQERLGSAVVQRVHDLNSGLMVMRRNAFRMDVAERFCLELEEAGNIHHLMEQDCFNVMASLVRSRPLPDRYWVGCNPDHAGDAQLARTACSKHYVSGVRYRDLSYLRDFLGRLRTGLGRNGTCHASA